MDPVNGMRTYVTRMHRGRGRQDGTPDSVHTKRVAALLVAAFKEVGETPTAKTLRTIECAALGHDLLEDTKAKPADIKRIAGAETLRLIDFLTNRWGDDDTMPYVRQMRSAPEEARLIKLADLSDNLFHASISAKTLGIPWMRNYFLPIVDPMRKMISATRFEKYPKTATILITSAALGRTHLEESIKNVRAGKWIGDRKH